MDDAFITSTEMSVSDDLNKNLIPLVKQADNTSIPTEKLVSTFIFSRSKGLETYSEKSETTGSKTQHYIEVRINNQLHRVDCDRQVDVPVEVAEVIQHLNGLE